MMLYRLVPKGMRFKPIWFLAENMGDAVNVVLLIATQTARTDHEVFGAEFRDAEGALLCILECPVSITSARRR